MTISGITPTGRGDALLLAHCAAFGDTPNAYARVEEQLGEHLARLLVSGLSAPVGARRLLLAVDADEEERQEADDAADDERDAA